MKIMKKRNIWHERNLEIEIGKKKAAMIIKYLEALTMSCLGGYAAGKLARIIIEKLRMGFIPSVIFSGVTLVGFEVLLHNTIIDWWQTEFDNDAEQLESIISELEELRSPILFDGNIGPNGLTDESLN